MYMNIKRKSKKSEFKDKKFGFGGRKKRSKYNTADSYAEPYNMKKNNKNMKMKMNNKNAKKFVNKNKKNSKRK
jgi:rRNA-processing protein EBP2